MKKNLFLSVLSTILLISTATYAESTEAYDDETKCIATGADKVFPNEYAKASHAWCQTGSDATYMLEKLFKATANGYGWFHSGYAGLSKESGFTAIALGGYKLRFGIYYVIGESEYISLRFTNVDDVTKLDDNVDVTYRLGKSMLGNLPPKK